MEAFFFWIFSIGAIGFAIAVLVNRNPVASALSLVVSMLFLACLFIMLRAFLLGTLQVLVYAGAVMVLFLFIIMLLDLRAEKRRPRSILAYFFGLALAFFMGVMFFQVIRAMPEVHTSSASLPPAPADQIVRIGNSLFTEYMLPFEVVGVLLLIGTLGVVLLSQRQKEKAGTAEEN